MAARGKIRFKASDIWEAPDDDRRYEVVDGELVMTPAPGWQHQFCLFELAVRIDQWVRPRGLGRVALAPVGVVLDEETAVQPDLVYIAREHFGLISERGVEGAPDLVVEVLSPSTEARDRGIKLRRYASAGVPHYWLLDPQHKALEAYRLGEAGYELTGNYGTGSTFRPDLFPGLEIAIDGLWAS
jgi:Uma2 family endonuclease